MPAREKTKRPHLFCVFSSFVLSGTPSKSVATLLQRRSMGLNDTSTCAKCGWQHGKANQPQVCPPECDQCGIRHGSHHAFRKKNHLPSVCAPRGPCPDANTTRATVADYPILRRQRASPDRRARWARNRGRQQLLDPHHFTVSNACRESVQVERPRS